MKKTKIIASIVALSCTMGVLSAKPKADSSSGKSLSGKIKVLSAMDSEAAEMTDKYFKPTHKKADVEYTSGSVEWGEFTKQEPSKVFEEESPDVIILESSILRKYVESGLLLPLDDVYASVKKDVAEYPAKVASDGGHVYAMSWQVCPGAMYYRRSLAKKYLGTDDPKKVQAYFANPKKMLETARLLQSKSFGKCVLTSTIDELLGVYKGSRKQPWVVNGAITVDPAMEEYIDTAKTLTDEGLVGDTHMWWDQWSAAFRGEYVNNDGEEKEVFCTFLPTWGLHYVLKKNAPETSGDWAICQGPTAWFNGGTWLAASKDTKNPELAKEYIKYLTSDYDCLLNYAKSSGDTVSNLKVQAELQKKTSEPFLGGQNHYKEFCSYAKKINGSLVQSTDVDIEDIFSREVTAYINGEKTKEEALDDFKSAAAELLD